MLAHLLQILRSEADCRGVTVVEYGLIAVLICAVLLTTFSAGSVFAGAMNAAFVSIGASAAPD